MEQPNHGAITHLLPFIEQEPLWKKFVRYTGGPPVAGGMVFEDPQSLKNWPDVEENQSHPQAAWWNNATNALLAQTRISILLCPSENPYSNRQFTSVCTIVGQNQFVNVLVPVNEGGATLGRTNYIANGGAIGRTTDEYYEKYVGPFFSRSKVSLANLFDGTANTLLFGETLGGETHGRRTRALSWMGAGAMPTAFGLTSRSFAWNFSSNHGVVQFAMADGSLRSFRRFDKDGQAPAFFTPAWLNFQRLGGMQDKERVEFDLDN